MTVEARLSRLLMEHHVHEAARTLEAMPVEEAAGAISDVPGEIAAGVVARMEVARAADCLRTCSEDAAASVLNAMPVRAAMPIVRWLPTPDRERVLRDLDEKQAHRFRRSLGFAADTAGAIMDTGVDSFADDVQIGEAVRRIRRQSLNLLYYVFVTDREHRLVGVLTLRELLQAAPRRLLHEVAVRPVEHLHVNDEIPVILGHPAWQDFHVLPVVDDSGILAGVLRYETLRQLESESTSIEPPGFVALGAALGETWVSVAALLLDGFGGALGAIRTKDHEVGGEA